MTIGASNAFSPVGQANLGGSNAKRLWVTANATFAGSALCRQPFQLYSHDDSLSVGFGLGDFCRSPKASQPLRFSRSACWEVPTTLKGKLTVKPQQVRKASMLWSPKHSKHKDRSHLLCDVSSCDSLLSHTVCLELCLLGISQPQCCIRHAQSLHT